MPTQECTFSELLYLFQANPDLLEDDEWRALREHLTLDPPCPVCTKETFRNRVFLEACEEFFQEQRLAARDLVTRTDKSQGITRGSERISFPTLSAQSRHRQEETKVDRGEVERIEVESTLYTFSQDSEDYAIYVEGEIPDGSIKAKFFDGSTFRLERVAGSVRLYRIVDLGLPELRDFIKRAGARPLLHFLQEDE